MLVIRPETVIESVKLFVSAFAPKNEINAESNASLAKYFMMTKEVSIIISAQRYTFIWKSRMN